MSNQTVQQLIQEWEYDPELAEEAYRVNPTDNIKLLVKWINRSGHAWLAERRSQLNVNENQPKKQDKQGQSDKKESVEMPKVAEKKQEKIEQEQEVIDKLERSYLKQEIQLEDISQHSGQQNREPAQIAEQHQPKNQKPQYKTKDNNEIDQQDIYGEGQEKHKPMQSFQQKKMSNKEAIISELLGYGMDQKKVRSVCQKYDSDNLEFMMEKCLQGEEEHDNSMISEEQATMNAMDEIIIQNLVDMNFPRAVCQLAVKKNSDKDLQNLINWIMDYNEKESQKVRKRPAAQKCVSDNSPRMEELHRLQQQQRRPGLINSTFEDNQGQIEKFRKKPFIQKIDSEKMQQMKNKEQQEIVEKQISQQQNKEKEPNQLTEQQKQELKDKREIQYWRRKTEELRQSKHGLILPRNDFMMDSSHMSMLSGLSPEARQQYIAQYRRASEKKTSPYGIDKLPQIQGLEQIEDIQAITESQKLQRMKLIIKTLKQLRRSRIDEQKENRRKYLLQYSEDEQEAKRMILKQIDQKKKKKEEQEKRKREQFDLKIKEVTDKLLRLQKKEKEKLQKEQLTKKKWSQVKLDFDYMEMQQYANIISQCENLNVYRLKDEKAAENVFDIILKLLKNIVKNPTDDKYRRVKKNNAILEKKLYSYPKSNDLLQTIGFRNGQGEYFIEQEKRSVAELNKIIYIFESYYQKEQPAFSE